MVCIVVLTFAPARQRHVSLKLQCLCQRFWAYFTLKATAQRILRDIQIVLCL
jgi:hypothetical protein